MKKKSVSGKIKFRPGFEFLRYVVAILLAIIIAIIIILLVSDEPGTALYKFLIGPVTKERYVRNVIELMIPLMFAGLGVSLLLRVKVFNMAAEGMFYAGGLAAAAVGCMVSMPAGIHPAVALIASGLAGALVSFIPTIFKVKFDANIIVSSLMMNYIVFQIGDYILKYFLRDPDVASRIISYTYKSTAVLPQIRKVHIGIFIIIVLLIAAYLFLFKTRWGYAVRLVGENSKFAQYSGIKTMKVILVIQLIGGFIVGLGGGVQILGTTSRFNWEWRPGYGWNGLVVAVIAKYNPKMIPFAAFILAYMTIGSDIMSRATDVPNEVVSIIQGIMIILVISAGFLSGLKERMLIKSKKTALEEV